ncbi:MAG: coenzyme F420-0:L-glutamate ligase [Chloroflexota bacterium]
MTQPELTLTAVPGIPGCSRRRCSRSDPGGADWSRDGAGGWRRDLHCTEDHLKAEGRMVRLADVEPGPRALDVAAQADKDPRLVELMLRESDEISRLRPGVVILRHRLGFTSANAGIDRSNVVQDGTGEETVLLLPVDLMRQPGTSGRQFWTGLVSPLAW